MGRVHQIDSGYFDPPDEETEPLDGYYDENRKLELSMDEIMSPKAAIVYLKDAANYFLHRDTKGEDSAFWANVQNAENCRRVARLIASLSPDDLDVP